MPEWASTLLSTHGTYLGFPVGPGRVDKVWGKALKKYSERVRLWSGMGLGLHFGIRAYSTLVVTVLSFLWQFSNIPKELILAEYACLNLFTVGPGMWRSSQDLHGLRSLIHFPMEFISIESAAWAAKLRLIRTIAGDLSNLQEALASSCNRANHLDRLYKWDLWYKSAIICVLTKAVEHARALSICPWKRAAELEQDNCANKRLQSDPYTKIHMHPCQRMNVRDRIRKKLTRWKLPLPLFMLATRAANRTERLSRLVAPRVMAAVFCTLCNGWCTRARFQQDGPCCLGCSGDALDRIEHYAHYIFLKRLLRQRLRLPPTTSMTLFLCLDKSGSDEVPALRAMATYATYSAVNSFRNCTTYPTEHVVNNVLEQFVKSAGEDHQLTSNTSSNLYRCR